MTAPRVTMIGVGNLMEVIWPVISTTIGGHDAASRLIGVTADAADIERKAAHFGFEMVLDDNLGALRRNRPDIIMFSPPPSVAPELIDSVLVPYYAERRSGTGIGDSIGEGNGEDPLPELYAFPPVPSGAAYLDALGPDVRVVNIIPNNVTTIAGRPIDDEGFYVCTFPSPWPEDRVEALRSVFDGQGAFIELAPDQLVPMLGGAATVSSLWYAVPAIADALDVDHNELGRFLRARLHPDADRAVEPEAQPPKADLLSAVIEAWRSGVERYYGETGIEPQRARLLLERGLDLTLHTIAAEPREVLVGHSVGAATRGGVLEKAIHSARDRLLPEILAATAQPDAPGWREDLTELVADVCRSVGAHGKTLAN